MIRASLIIVVASLSVISCSTGIREAEGRIYGSWVLDKKASFEHYVQHIRSLSVPEQKKEDAIAQAKKMYNDTAPVLMRITKSDGIIFTGNDSDGNRLLVCTVDKVDGDTVIVDLDLDPIVNGVKSTVDLDRLGIKFINNDTIRMYTYSERNGAVLGNKLWHRAKTNKNANKTLHPNSADRLTPAASSDEF